MSRRALNTYLLLCAVGDLYLDFPCFVFMFLIMIVSVISHHVMIVAVIRFF